MGYQYGYLLADRIEGGLELINQLAITKVQEQFKFVPAWLIRFATKIIGQIFWFTYPSTAKDMMKGLVKGVKDKDPSVKVHYRDIALVNSIIDLVAIVHRLGDKGPKSMKLLGKLISGFGIDVRLRHLIQRLPRNKAISLSHKRLRDRRFRCQACGYAQLSFLLCRDAAYPSR